MWRSLNVVLDILRKQMPTSASAVAPHRLVADPSKVGPMSDKYLANDTTRTRGFRGAAEAFKEYSECVVSVSRRNGRSESCIRCSEATC